MPKFRIREEADVIIVWEAVVEAETEEEALDRYREIENGDPRLTRTEEDAHPNFTNEIDVEEVLDLEDED